MKIGKPQIKHVFNMWAVILIVWGVYRAYVRGMPEWIDEFIFKPFIFLCPVIWYVKRVEKKSLASIGFAKGKLWRDIKIGTGIGLIFGLEGILANWIKYGEFNFLPIVDISGLALLFVLVVGFATALVEEAFGRGFIFSRLTHYYNNNELKAAIVSSGMFFLLHVPIIFTTLQLTGTTLAIFIVTDLILAFATAIFYHETKTLTVPVLVHLFWNMTVALYL